MLLTILIASVLVAGIVLGILSPIGNRSAGVAAGLGGVMLLGAFVIYPNKCRAESMFDVMILRFQTEIASACDGTLVLAGYTFLIGALVVAIRTYRTNGK